MKPQGVNFHLFYLYYFRAGSSQYLPEHLAMSQQPQETTNMRLDHRPLSSNGAMAVNGAPKPRRHSINHPPSIASSITGQFHPYGLGMSTVPASPLRKQFSRGDVDPSSSS